MLKVQRSRAATTSTESCTESSDPMGYPTPPSPQTEWGILPLLNLQMEWGFLPLQVLRPNALSSCHHPSYLHLPSAGIKE